MGLIDILRKLSTPRNLLVSIVMSIVVVTILGYATQVFVYSIYGNYTMPDTRFGYTFEEIQTVFDGLGSEGLQAWSIVHLLDYIFPLVYMFAMAFGISVELKKIDCFDEYNKLILIPITGCIMDYSENFLVQTQVLAYPNISPLVINIASYITLSKWMLLGLGFVVIIVLLLQIIYQRNSMASD